MTEEEQLVLKIIGDADLVALNKELEKNKKIIVDATANFRNLSITQDQYEHVVEASILRIVQLNGEMKSLNINAKGFSQSGLQLSYILDDLTNTSGTWERHLAAISNNIPGLALSLGSGAGLAGIIGLVSTALIAMAPLATMAYNAIKGINADQMKELAEEAKKFNAELQKILASRTPEAEKTQKGFEEFFAGQGAQVQEGIAGALTATGRGAGLTKAEQAEIRSLDESVLIAVDKGPAQLRRQQAMQRIHQAQMERTRTAAGQLLGKAPTEAAARGVIGRLAAAQPGLFPRGFAGDFASMEPEAGAAADAEAEAFDAVNRDYVARRDLARERAKQKKAQDKAAEKIVKEKAKHEKDVADAEDEAMDAHHAIDQANARDAKKAQAQAVANKRKADAAARHRVVQGKQDAVAAKRLGEEQQLSTYSNFFEGQGASSEQAIAMAHDTVRGMQQGLSLSQASFEAWTGMQRQLQKVQMQMMQLQGAFQGGMAADNRQLGGQNFSFQSPMPGQ